MWDFLLGFSLAAVIAIALVIWYVVLVVKKLTR